MFANNEAVSRKSASDFPKTDPVCRKSPSDLPKTDPLSRKTVAVFPNKEPMRRSIVAMSLTQSLCTVTSTCCFVTQPRGAGKLVLISLKMKL